MTFIQSGKCELFRRHHFRTIAQRHHEICSSLNTIAGAFELAGSLFSLGQVPKDDRCSLQFAALATVDMRVFYGALYNFCTLAEILGAAAAGALPLCSLGGNIFNGNLSKELAVD